MDESCVHGLRDYRWRQRLVIFVKEPQPGRVKTRLASGIGTVAAAHWYRRTAKGLLSRVSRDSRWETLLAVTPDRVGLASRVWPPDIVRIPQGGGNLGHRMARVMRSLPPGPVMIIGSDIPGISPARIADAFAQLAGHDAVFGPASDGGYWSIGVRHTGALPRRGLRHVRWSTPQALSDSVRSLHGMRIAYATTLDDIDTVRDYWAARCASST